MRRRGLSVRLRSKRVFLFCLLLMSTAAAGECRGLSASREEDRAEASRFLNEIQSAVRTNDANKLAAMTLFPLTVSGKNAIANQSQFVREYTKLFDAPIRTRIVEQDPKCLFGSWRGFMIGDGELWFEMIRKKDSDPWVFKIVAINNDRYKARRKAKPVV